MDNNSDDATKPTVSEFTTVNLHPVKRFPRRDVPKGTPVFAIKNRKSYYFKRTQDKNFPSQILTVTASGEITVDNSSDDGVKPTVSEFTTVNYIQ